LPFVFQVELQAGPIDRSRMKLPQLILASASPRRAELLRRMNLEFLVIPSDAMEVHHEHLTAREISQINAYRKARAVAKKLPDALVLGADTLVSLDGKIFGKPRNLAEARGMLGELQGRTHQVVTGVCLIHLRAHWQKVFAEMTDVTFLDLTPDQIESYLRRVDPLDKAGGYGIQQHGDLLIRDIDGSYGNVMGLPTERVRAELEAWPRAIQS